MSEFVYLNLVRFNFFLSTFCRFICNSPLIAFLALKMRFISIFYTVCLCCCYKFAIVMTQCRNDLFHHNAALCTQTFLHISVFCTGRLYASAITSGNNGVLMRSNRLQLEVIHKTFIAFQRCQNAFANSKLSIFQML